MRRDSIGVLAARGFTSALITWKALVLVLMLNALFAFALARPFSAALHGALDHNPERETLVQRADPTFWTHFSRKHPDLLGDTTPWEELASGNPVKGGFFGLTGAAGNAVYLGLFAALMAALASGGFAGRFGAERDRASLAAFGSDTGRFAFSSLLLGLLSMAGVLASYRFVFAETARFYDSSELRYEWEGIALGLLRLLAFLLVAGSIRLVILYARASIGISRNGNPFLALASGLGFVLRRPVRTLALEILFGVLGIAPLLLWGAWGPSWDGRDLVSLLILTLAQQILVLFRIAFRVAHLGAASAFIRRIAESMRPAPEMIESPAEASQVLVGRGAEAAARESTSA